MEMKFSIGERVKVIEKNLVGEVVQMEYAYYQYQDGSKKIIKRYLVRQLNHAYYQNWYEESKLISDDELSDKYAKRVYDVLIDVNLMIGNFDMVKLLVEEKEKYIK